MSTVDLATEVAKGLVALHRRSPMAAFTTARWIVTTAPRTARMVAVLYAAYLATPIRVLMARAAQQHDCTDACGPSFVLFERGQQVDVDVAPLRIRTIARMVSYSAHSDPGGAAAAWDALVATGTRWQVVEVLHALAAHVVHLDGDPLTLVEHGQH